MYRIRPFSINRNFLIIWNRMLYFRNFVIFRLSEPILLVRLLVAVQSNSRQRKPPLVLFPCHFVLHFILIAISILFVFLKIYVSLLHDAGLFTCKIYYEMPSFHQFSLTAKEIRVNLIVWVSTSSCLILWYLRIYFLYFQPCKMNMIRHWRKTKTVTVLCKMYCKMVFSISMLMSEFFL